MHPKPVVFSIILVALIALLYSCDAIIEPSITKQQVNLEAPVNQYQSTGYTINFWWDPLNNAISYHLQVVSQTFSAPGGLILDTVVTAYKFSYTLSPGSYQWRVMAENGSTQTAYTAPRSFTILPSSIIVQTEQISTPANNYLTNQAATVFQWSTMYGATQYRFEIDTNNFTSSTAVVSNQVVYGQQITFTFPKDQVYQWRVRAENDTAQSQWSTVYQVTYDHTPPGQVSLVSPVNGAIDPLPVSLQWTSVPTAVSYKVYVLQSDSTSLYSSSYPVTVTGTSYSFNSGTSGTKIYWKITALDAAGNESQPSLLRNFVIQ